MRLQHPIPSPALQPRHALRRSLWGVFAVLASTSLWAAEPVIAPEAAAGHSRPDQRVEHITHEDGGSRVDELRVGGQTQTIEVQTKSGMPSYQISPAVGTQGASAPSGERSGSTGTSGRTSWRVLKF
jgi:hypothetical protein